MKWFSIFLVMMAFLSMTSCNQSVSKVDSDSAQEGKEALMPVEFDPFEAFAEHFSETASFAYAEVSGCKVLLVSQETFGNDENEDREAIEASIFALDSKDKIVALGSIRSQGTLYPVSLLDGKLMEAGHQFVRIYSIIGDVPELVLDSYWEGEDPEQTEMLETFEKGTSIKFNKSLKE